MTLEDAAAAEEIFRDAIASVAGVPRAGVAVVAIREAERRRLAGLAISEAERRRLATATSEVVSVEYEIFARDASDADALGARMETASPDVVDDALTAAAAKADEATAAFVATSTTIAVATWTATAPPTPPPATGGPTPLVECPVVFHKFLERDDVAADDVARTSGDCKRYGNAVALQSLAEASDCLVKMRVAVDDGGALYRRPSRISCPPASLRTSRGRSQQSNAAKTSSKRSSYGRYFRNQTNATVRNETLGGATIYALQGAATAVAAAIADFEFCPGCAGETYALTFSLDETRCGDCVVPAAEEVLLIEAATALRRRFAGRVVEAGCGENCWSEGVPDVDVSLDVPGRCPFVATVKTASDGAYLLTAPYDADAIIPASETTRLEGRGDAAARIKSADGVAAK